MQFTEKFTTNTNLLHSPADNSTPVVACDLEGTLTSGYTWQGMRNYLLENGQEKAFRRLIRRNMLPILLFRAGLGDKQAFKSKWVRGVLGLCKGLTHAQFQDMAEQVVQQEFWPNRRQGVIDELLTHRRNGRRVIIISGVFEPILGQLLNQLGHGIEGIGTPIVFKNDICTGEIFDEINVGERKVAQLQPFLSNGRIAAAYGDTAPDIPMLEIATEAVAVQPDKNLRQLAETKGWRILSEVPHL